MNLQQRLLVSLALFVVLQIKISQSNAIKGASTEDADGNFFRLDSFSLIDRSPLCPSNLELIAPNDANNNTRLLKLNDVDCTGPQLQFWSQDRYESDVEGKNTMLGVPSTVEAGPGARDVIRRAGAPFAYAYLRAGDKEPTLKCGNISLQAGTGFVLLNEPRPMHLPFATFPAQLTILFVTSPNPGRACVFQKEEPDPTPNASGSPEPEETPVCFPAEATVRVISHLGDVSTRMDGLKGGETVRDGDGKPTQVYGFTHSSPDGQNRFLAAYIESDTKALTASTGHLVLTRTSGGQIKALPMRELRAGIHCLVRSSGGCARVIRIRKVRRPGLYHPHTISGTIDVDGFAATTHADAVQPATADAMLLPARIAFKTVGFILDLPENVRLGLIGIWSALRLGS